MPLFDIRAVVDRLLLKMDPLNAFLETAEATIFDPDNIKNVGADTLRELYVLGVKRQEQIVDMARRVMSTSKNSQEDPQLLAMARMLASLKKEDLVKLKEFMTLRQVEYEKEKVKNA